MHDKNIIPQPPENDGAGQRKLIRRLNKKISSLQEEKKQLEDDTEKLLILADACSDRVYGGERGWEQVIFDEFVTRVKERLDKSQCSATGQCECWKVACKNESNEVNKWRSKLDLAVESLDEAVMKSSDTSITDRLELALTKIKEQK